MNTQEGLIRLGSTNPELRQHIRPILSAIVASRGPDVELTTNPQEGRTSWPNVTWNGRDVLDKYTSSADKFQKKLKADRNSGLTDSQEVYLGYDPRRDVFVIGFDAWYEDTHGDTSFGHVYVSWHMGTNNFGEPAISEDGGFYDAGHNLVHRRYPGIVDLRLD